MENVLIHHGVKGQKWGVRRYQNEDGSLTTAGKQRQEKEESETKGKSIAKKIGIATAVGASVLATGYALNRGRNFISGKIVESSMSKLVYGSGGSKSNSYSKGKEFVSGLLALPQIINMRRNFGK